MSQRNTSHVVSAPFGITLSRDMAVFACFAACVAISFAFYVAVIKAYSNDSIFGAMYRAAFWLEMEDSWWPMITALKHLKQAEFQDLYKQIFFTDKIKFQYSMTSLLFMDFLSLIFPLTYPNLNIFNFGLMPLIAVSLTWLSRELGLWREWRQGALWFCACGVWTLTFFPIVGALNLGQVQLWIDLLFVLACVLWIRDERLGTGIIIGLIALIKPQMAALLLWAVLRRHWIFVRGFLAVTVPLTFLSIYLYGFWNNLDYIGVLQFVAKHGELYFANQSVNGLLNRFFAEDVNNVYFSDEEFATYDPRVHIGTLISSAIFMAIALFYRIGPREDRTGLDFLVAAFTFTIASPVVWDHHYGITPAMLMVAFAVMRQQQAQGRPIAGHAFLLLGAFILIGANLNAFCNTWRHTPIGTLVQSYKFYGGLMLFVLLVSLRASFAPRAVRAPA